MNEFDLISLESSSALLAQRAGITVLGPWQAAGTQGVWMQRLRLELLGAAPTPELPQFTDWELVVDFTLDVWGKVQLHPALTDQALTVTFAHQQFNGGPHPLWPCRNGHICTMSWLQGLAGSRNAYVTEPTTTIERLCWHVARAQEWLTLAATNDLTQPGDPFELPDFNIGQNALGGALAYYEDERSFAQWQQHSVRSGIADIIDWRGIVFTRRFRDKRNKDVLYEPAWGDAIAQLPETRKAIWIRLDAVPVVNRWQIPLTGSSLIDTIKQQGIDLVALLNQPLAVLPELGEWLLLVGIPIPKRIGEEPYRYHWQALQLLPNVAKLAKLAQKARVATVVNRLPSSSPIRWQPIAENWHPDYLQSRGRLSPQLSSARVVLLGAGSLGSVFGEQLVRMGVQNLTIIDPEPFEPGNLVRHTLSLTDVYIPKVSALAAHLNQVNPSARVTGLVLALPSTDPFINDVFRNANLVIDATASDDVLKAMPLRGLPSSVPFISCSLGLNADRLFFYATLSEQFRWDQFNQWFSPYRAEENQKALDLELPRGVGCWHALVPARLNRITGLACQAVDLIEQLYLDTLPSPVELVYSWPSKVSQLSTVELVA